MTHFSHGAFPYLRMRRFRRTAWMRALLQEHMLQSADLIWPVFVRRDESCPRHIEAMPGIVRYTPDELVVAAADAYNLGIRCIAIFPVIEQELKDEKGSEALNPDNLICHTVRLLKQKVPQIGVICDVALDPYTTHGHDGLFENDVVLNDQTVEVLVQQALLQAEAGCDILAPSDMMDGRIAALRAALEKHHFQDVAILSYAAKYASAFYGPFRDAIGSGKLLRGDKKTYQLNPANIFEAMREVELDLHEGADMIMVKPGMPYLDVMSRIKTSFGVPTFAYQVSGEYAMLSHAAASQVMNREDLIIESLMCFKRAGADGILSYFALEAAQILQDYH